jgi:hypothetical protein
MGYGVRMRAIFYPANNDLNNPKKYGIKNEPVSKLG